MSYYLFHNCITGEDTKIDGLTENHLADEAERQGLAERKHMDIQFDRNYGAIFVVSGCRWKQVAAARGVGMRKSA